MSLKINETTAVPIREADEAYAGAAAAAKADFKKTFAALIEEKRATIRETLEEMNARKMELNEIRKMQKFTETVRRILPDGSILISEYEDGKLVGRDRQKPHLKAVPDESAPPPPLAPDGTVLTTQQEMKLVPRQNIFEGLL